MPIHRHRHTRESHPWAHRHAHRPREPTPGPVAPANTLQKQNRQPAERPPLRSPFSTAKKAGLGGEGCWRRSVEVPAESARRSARPAGAKRGRGRAAHLLRRPHGAAAAPRSPEAAAPPLPPLPPAAARPGSSGRPRAPRAGGAAPRPAGPRPRPPRSDVRRLGAGYLWQGYSECSLGRVLIAAPWDL